MIIRRIQANNVLKYLSLELDELPTHGLIAISGHNESGKSSIGETVCFALFGRTYSIKEDELTKVIRWDQTHCSVELDFSIGEDHLFRIERFLDTQGNHSARLSAIDGEDEEVLARGVDDVANELHNLMGYEFDEFIESFYLAQREITTPHPHSMTIKNIAGVLTLEYSSMGLQDDIDEAQAVIDESEEEMASVAEQLDEVALDPAVLPAMMEERAQRVDQMNQRKERISGLEKSAAVYATALPRRNQALRQRGSAGFWRFMALILAFVAGGLWGLLSQMPEHALAQQATALLEANVPNWQADKLPWLLYAAGGFAALFILFWTRKAAAVRRAAEQEAAATDLAAELQALNGLSPIPAQTNDSDEEPEVTAEGEDGAERTALAGRVAAFDAGADEVEKFVKREKGLLQRDVAALQMRVAEADASIQEEQERLEHFTSLQKVRADLNGKIRERGEFIKACTLADELVQGTVKNITNEFNIKLRELVSRTLPLFTEGRYEHLQIADDLTVRVFSREKRDFMDLDEISSGTQRQIMLAVRLALSEELVRRTEGGSQFLFLDEPFAFFDKKRMRGSLEVLPRLSGELQQIWIVAQEFPEDMEFDVHIECDRNFVRMPEVV